MQNPNSITLIRRRAHAARLQNHALNLLAASLTALELHLHAVTGPESKRQAAVAIFDILGQSVHHNRRAYSLPQIAAALAELHNRYPLTTHQRAEAQELFAALDRNPRALFRALRREVLSPIQRTHFLRLIKAHPTADSINPCQSTAPLYTFSIPESQSP